MRDNNKPTALEMAHIERHKDSPNFCKVYAKRTPAIPFHNGQYVKGDKCIGCGRVKP